MEKGGGQKYRGVVKQSVKGDEDIRRHKATELLDADVILDERGLRRLNQGQDPVEATHWVTEGVEG